MNVKTSLKIWILAGASSVVLAAVVVTLSTVAVHADARLSRPSANLPASSLASGPTPGSLAEATALKRGDRLHGIASWYGGRFDGRKTASGERFNMYAMTACHPTLPFGSVVVKITDRGDLVTQKRIIDLSYGAAQKLAMTGAGLAMVDLQVLSLGPEKDKQ